MLTLLTYQLNAISPTFNIEDLVVYNSPMAIPNQPFDSASMPSAPKSALITLPLPTGSFYSG